MSNAISERLPCANRRTGSSAVFHSVRYHLAQYLGYR